MMIKLIAEAGAWHKVRAGLGIHYTNLDAIGAWPVLIWILLRPPPEPPKRRVGFHSKVKP